MRWGGDIAVVKTGTRQECLDWMAKPTWDGGGRYALIKWEGLFYSKKIDETEDKTWWNFQLKEVE